MTIGEQINQVCLNQCLNPAEKLAIRASLTQLSCEDPFGTVSFWGKIYTVHSDYLIAKSLNLKVEISKRFYFSVDQGKTFAILPNIDAWVADKASKYHGLFTGDPSAQLVEFVPGKGEGDQQGEEQQAADGDNDDAASASTRQLTELERLAWTISTIDYHTDLIIKGSYIRNAAGDLIPNPNFQGLQSPAQLLDLNNFEHLRQSQDPDNLLVMTKRLETFSIKAALDTIASDLPKSVWTVSAVDSSGSSAHLHNHLWPGFSARVSIGSSKIEQTCYFGYGQRNQDLVFGL